ncbi:MAG: AIPR family protein [Cyanobacteria bacterium J06634_5]
MAATSLGAHKIQIETILEANYFPIIPALDKAWTSDQLRKNRLSRSLAAFSIEQLAGVTYAEAANAVIDGENDNGIDAIHFDRHKQKLWIVQSKAGNAPNMGENKKLCDGVRDLVNYRFSKFNDKFSRLQSNVEDALSRTGVEIVACHVHLGENLASHAITDLNQLKDELNNFEHRFDWKELNLASIHHWLTTSQAITPPNVRVTLEHWHRVRQPRRAFYGLITAGQLSSLYHEHGKALFEQNIRHYLGTGDVNQAISETVRERPEDLFYLNNGLTAICSEISSTVGSNQDKGDFELKSFSIVNGAQTVGSVAAGISDDEPSSKDAKVLLTLIEVGNDPGDVGTKITRARNTQNSVKYLDFAALDPNQERLRQELAISDITYRYRPSADHVPSSQAVSIEEAVIALACFTGNTGVVVTAKKDRGQLYSNFNSLLFPESLTGVRLYRYVQVFKYLDGILDGSENAETSTRRRLFYRHSRFFLMHILARKHKALLNKNELCICEDDKLLLSDVVTQIAETVYEIAEAQFSDGKGYLAIFRNVTDSTPLAKAVMEALEEQESRT